MAPHHYYHHPRLIMNMKTPSFENHKYTGSGTRIAGNPDTRASGGSGTGKRSRMIWGSSKELTRGEEHTHLGFFGWGSYKLLSLLGKGRTGSVFKAK